MLTLVIPDATQMHLTVYDKGRRALDMTSSAQWTTTSNIGSVHNGMVTCHQAGIFTVQAVLGPTVARSNITCITPRVITDIRVANTPAVVRSEAPYTFRAVADYSDGTTSDILPSAIWSSTTPNVYITDTGTVFCNASGNVTIDVKFESKTASTSFKCILAQITSFAGFTETEQQFYGPFPSWIDVKTRFGAKGDGVTDDTQALQNALDSLSIHSAVLWLPRGVYKITQPLHIRSVGAFSIIGENPETTSVEWSGATGATMFSIEGCNWFRIARLSWNGMNSASVALNIDSTLTDGEYYPTFDAIQDQKISNVGIGLLVGFAGETSVQRVHFDHASVAGISLVNFNALNFNVLDSLFTDCNIGVTNRYGAGAFNVSNSVFVRSQTADMVMGNTGPFSERQNISIDSKAFFISLPIGAGANILLQGNKIIRPQINPIQIGSPGPIMLIDNEFLQMNPSFHIMVGIGSHQTGVFSLGNKFTPTQPFGGNTGHITSIAEAPSTQDSPLNFVIPSEIDFPSRSSLPIYEVAAGSTASTIQQVIAMAASNPEGGIVHFPLGVFSIDHTLSINTTKSITIIGDGPITILQGTTSLDGPVMRTAATNIAFENFRITSSPYSTADAGLEIIAKDDPSTMVYCNQCKTGHADIGIEFDGLDNAVIEFRAALLSASGFGAEVQGGAARSMGHETLGRVDAFMTSSDAYHVLNNGHFLLEDGWHDTGQGTLQFTLEGSGRVTHQGGVIYTNSANSMMMNQFSGELSLLGVSTDSDLNIDDGSNAQILVASSAQVAGRRVVDANGSSGIVADVSNYTIVNNGTPIFQPDAMSTTTSWIEHMFAQARDEYVTFDLKPSISATHIDMNRLEVDTVKTAIRLLPQQNPASNGSYTISPAPENQVSSVAQTSCPTSGDSMSGEWTLERGVDGSFGLKRQTSFLANVMTGGEAVEAVGVADVMSDARQRWIIRPTGDGLFEIVNRASGYLLTRGQNGCTALYPRLESREQEWVIDPHER